MLTGQPGHHVPVSSHMLELRSLSKGQAEKQPGGRICNWPMLMTDDSHDQSRRRVSWSGCCKEAQARYDASIKTASSTLCMNLVCSCSSSVACSAEVEEFRNRPGVFFSNPQALLVHLDCWLICTP